MYLFNSIYSITSIFIRSNVEFPRVAEEESDVVRDSAPAAIPSDENIITVNISDLIAQVSRKKDDKCARRSSNFLFTLLFFYFSCMAVLSSIIRPYFACVAGEIETGDETG